MSKIHILIWNKSLNMWIKFYRCASHGNLQADFCGTLQPLFPDHWCNIKVMVLQFKQFNQCTNGQTWVKADEVFRPFTMNISIQEIEITQADRLVSFTGRIWWEKDEQHLFKHKMHGLEIGEVHSKFQSISAVGNLELTQKHPGCVCIAGYPPQKCDSEESSISGSIWHRLLTVITGQ